MPTKRQPLCIALALSICLSLACEKDGPFVSGNSIDKEIGMGNESDIAVNMMAPGEVASPNNLVQPGGGRNAIVRYAAAAEVTFRASTDQGAFYILTCVFSSAGGDGAVTFRMANDGSRFPECSGGLFD